MDRAFNITTDMLMGKPISDEDKQWFRARNAKYEIVRALYMEKMKADGMKLSNFHFTPGESFADTPTIDILNELLKVNDSIKRGDYKECKFGDYSLNVPLAQR